MCVEGAQRGLTFGGAVAERQPCAFQKASSARKAPDTGWLPQPGWETWGRTEVPSAFGVWASILGGYSSFTLPTSWGKEHCCPSAGRERQALRRGLPFHTASPACTSLLAPPLPEFTLTLVSPDLMHLCFQGVSDSSVSSVAQSYLTFCDPMDCGTPGLPVHHQLPQSTQTRSYSHFRSWETLSICPTNSLLKIIL